MYKDKYGPWALIVGGSEGIGRALAEKLAADGMHLILVARKRQALEQTAAAAKSQGAIEVRLLVQDMTSPDMMAGIESITADVEVGLLIYNAGAMDRVTTFLGDTLEGHLHTVRLNCEGPLRLCYHFAKQMAARRRGGIVLMSSASGLAGAYGVPVYGATKAFDLILAEGLWCELKEFGVSVLCAVLGLVHTPAHERLMGQALPFGASAEDIAQEVLDHIDDGPTLFSRSVAALLPILRDPDRRAAVSQMAAASRKFFTGKINKAPIRARDNHRGRLRMKYVDVEAARASRGVRVVLTRGFPGPWGQAVKKMLEYKGIDYLPVAQLAGEDNASLKSWVGVRNAPVIVNDDERPLTTWSEAILFAERRRPDPALLPRDSASRAAVFGLIHELAQENGFGWCMRLMLFKGALDANPAARDQLMMKQMMRDYGFTDATVRSAPERIIDILEMLTARLTAQRALGSDYFVGKTVTAADIYWACFSIMVEPLPESLCPMTAEARRSSTPVHSGIIAAAAPILIEHRNRMFERFLGPLEF